MLLQSSKTFIRLAALICAITLGVLHPFPSAEASQVRPVALDGLCRHAGSIFVATIDYIDVRPDKGGILSTFYYFNVSEPLKGSQLGPVKVKMYGGSSGNIVSTIPGMPQFAPGQEHFLFLLPPSDYGFTSPVGLFQGSLPVERDDTGRGWVTIPQNISHFANRYPLSSQKKQWLQSGRVTIDELASIVLDLTATQ